MRKPLASDFAAQGSQYLGTSYAAMDCQAFVEQMLRDVGVNHNWSGSNAMYRDMAWVGTPEECRDKFGCIPVGAWLYILSDNGREPAKYKGDGLGNASHVGVYTAEGKGAIHSSSSRGCVAESAFSGKTIPNGGWNRVGLCKLLDYGGDVTAILNDNSKEMIPVAISTATVATSGGTLNLRAAPSRNGKVMAAIPNGSQLEVLEKTSEDWWKVSHGGKEGYVSVTYLQETQTVSVAIERSAATALHHALSSALGVSDHG